MAEVLQLKTKLRVLSFNSQFRSQVSKLRDSLNVVNLAAEQILGSVKFPRIIEAIVSMVSVLGLNRRLRLDDILKLMETRSQDNKMTLMHYFCKGNMKQTKESWKLIGHGINLGIMDRRIEGYLITLRDRLIILGIASVFSQVLADKRTELLDFWKDLPDMELALKIQMRFLAEEMQAISKGLETVKLELSMAENDGGGVRPFWEGEVRSLDLLYSGVGRNVDACIRYLGEDPSRCSFEQVMSAMLNFVRMFKQAHDENCKQLER